MQFQSYRPGKKVTLLTSPASGNSSGIKRVSVLILSAALVVLAGCERAKETPAETDRITLGANEHQKDFGDYTLHVNALTTDQLPQDVAKEYRIPRSNSRAMLNVVITKKAADGDEPVPGSVNANARNLAGQLKELEMREITEEKAIYYIADLSVDDKDTVTFDIDVVPVNESDPFKISYRHEFFH